MKNNKVYSILIILVLISLAITFTGCFSSDDNPVTQTAAGGNTIRSGGVFSFMSGEWVVEKLVDELFGMAFDKTTDPLIEMIFGNQTDKKIEQVLEELKVLDAKLETVVEQLNKIQTQISDLASQMSIELLNLEVNLTQKMSQSAISGINTLWSTYNNSIIISVDSKHTREQVLAACTSSVLLNFAYQVEPRDGSPVTRTYVQTINDVLLSGGLSADNSGLLKLWTDKAIIAYCQSSSKTPSDLMNYYNYIEMNFQSAMLYQAKGASMVITALQSIEKDNPSHRPTSLEYKNNLKSMFTAQAKEFRHQIERFILTCSNIKTSKNGNFLPDGYSSVFARADFIYSRIAGSADAKGFAYYGLCGRVISPFQIQGSTSVSASSMTLECAETDSQDSQTVNGGKIISQTIDYWFNDSFTSGNYPVCRFNTSKKWYIYRYYTSSPQSGSFTAELKNDVKNLIPACSSKFLVTNYDEANYAESSAASSSDSRVVNYGNFTIAAGFGGTSACYAVSPYASNVPQWKTSLSDSTSYSVTSASSATANTADLILNVGGYSTSAKANSGGGYVSSYSISAAAGRFLKYEGTSAVTAKIHYDIKATGHLSMSKKGHGCLANNSVVISISSVAAPFTASSALSEITNKTASANIPEEAQGFFESSERTADLPGTITGDLQVTLQPNQYYFLKLEASASGKSKGYWYTSGYHKQSYRNISYNASSCAEVNELYFTYE